MNNINNYQKSINESAKKYGIKPSMLSELIQAESCFHTLDKPKSNWIVSLFRKLFRKLFKIKDKEENKSCEFGLSQFTNQGKKNE